MRSIPIRFDNPVLFTATETGSPAEKALAIKIYGEKKIRKLSGIRIPFITVKNFIREWERLLRLFSTLLENNIGKSLYNHRLEENSLFYRLSQGIAQSVDDQKTGLLQHQKPIVFDELKRNLEELCYFLLTQTESDKSRSAPVLRDLYNNLDRCGPGLFQNIQEARNALYHPNGLLPWLTELRTLIIRQIADASTSDIPFDYKLHVHSVFYAHARGQKWNLSTNSELNDYHAAGLLKAVKFDLDMLTQDFRERYISEAVSYVADRLQKFIYDQFHFYAVNEKLEGDALSQFSEGVQKVMDSFQLDMNIFLEMKESEREGIYYVLNEKAMREIFIPVLHRFYVMGLIDSTTVHADTNTLIFHDNNHNKKYFVVTYSESGGLYHRYFETASAMTAEKIDEMVSDLETPAEALFDLVEKKEITLPLLMKIAAHHHCTDRVRNAILLSVAFRQKALGYLPEWDQAAPELILFKIASTTRSIDVMRLVISNGQCSDRILEKYLECACTFSDVQVVFDHARATESLQLLTLQKILQIESIPENEIAKLIEEIRTFWELLRDSTVSKAVTDEADINLVESIKLLVSHEVVCNFLLHATRCKSYLSDECANNKVDQIRFFSGRHCLNKESQHFPTENVLLKNQS